MGSGGTVKVMAFRFGPWRCPWSEAFYLTPHSIAIVNQKPIQPGHCLVLSRRVTARLVELTDAESADLWATVHKIAPALQRHFGGTSLTIALQDGTDAGQSVPHVHMHIIPRRPHDFKRNDDIYDALERVDADTRVARTAEEMAAEAAILRGIVHGGEAIPH